MTKERLDVFRHAAEVVAPGCAPRLQVGTERATVLDPLVRVGPERAFGLRFAQAVPLLPFLGALHALQLLGFTPRLARTEVFAFVALPGGDVDVVPHGSVACSSLLDHSFLRSAACSR